LKKRIKKDKFIEFVMEKSKYDLKEDVDKEFYEWFERRFEEEVKLWIKEIEFFKALDKKKKEEPNGKFKINYLRGKRNV